jgi:hypothetical protein
MTASTIATIRRAALASLVPPPRIAFGKPCLGIVYADAAVNVDEDGGTLACLSRFHVHTRRAAKPRC